MTRCKRLRLLGSMKPLIFVLAGLIPVMAGARTWTNAEGQEVEAAYVRTEGESVVLRVNGREIPYPLANLSEEDQEFVREKTAEPDGEAMDEHDSADDQVSRTAEIDEPVPDQVGPPEDFDIETIEEDADNEKYVYASNRFEFVCNRRLTSRVISGFAKLYEATYDAVQAMPWGARLDPRTDNGRFKVLLFSEEEDFIKAGGIVGSAGTAVGTLSLAQLRYLGVKDTGVRLILEDIEDNTLLVHELTHALRDDADRGMPTWAIEGFAEYIASAPYQRIGRFSFKDRFEDAARQARRKGAREPFTMPMRLEQMLKAERSEFYKDSGGGLGEGASINYAMSVLVMTYFWHEDQGKDDAREVGAPIRDWLKARKEGKSVDEAYALLLDGRSYEEIEGAIESAYRRELELEFNQSAE